jgi:hypothetical protein
MPIFDAVYWIASRGHSENPTAGWDNAVREMIAALVGKRLGALGTRRGNNTAEDEDIPAYDWQGVVNNRMKREPYLFLIGPAGEHDSDDGEFQDALFMRGEVEPKWQRLAVRQADVRKLWPFHLTQTEAAPELTKYGYRRGQKWRPDDEPISQKTEKGDSRAPAANKSAKDARGKGTDAAPEVTKYGHLPGQKWRPADEPIFQKMSEAMEIGDSRAAAANKFAKDAWGKGTEGSKAKRLRDGYLHWVASKKRD